MISLRCVVVLAPAIVVAMLVAPSCTQPDKTGSNTAAAAADSIGGRIGDSAPQDNAASGANSGTPNAGTPDAAPGTSNAGASAALSADTAPLNIPVVTPGPGSSMRTMILDAVRQRLNLKTRFKVDHIRMAGLWAFVRATEVVELDKGELQETDLTISALLELPKATPTKFRVVEIWTLPDEQTRPFAEFVRKVREHVKRERLPVGILPDDFH